MDRALIVGVAVVTVGLGCGTAVLRPGLAPVGTLPPPSFGSGVVVESWGGGGGGGAAASRGPRRRPDVSRFAGRGPGGAK